MRRVAIAMLITTSLLVASQHTVDYVYDSAGNRIQRYLFYASHNQKSKSANIPKVCYDQLGDKEVKISMYTTGLLRVSVVGYEANDVGIIEIYSIIGQIVLKRNIATADTDIDISELTYGVYVMVVSLNNNTTTWKITRE